MFKPTVRILPLNPNGSAYGIALLTKYVRHLILDMKRKFGNNNAIKYGPPFFAENDVTQMLKTLDSHHGRTLMIGSKESDVFKESFPIPRQHSQQTKLLPFNDFPKQEHRVLSRSVDLISMAKTLFTRGEFIKAAKLLCTFNGIGRGREIKFLSYDKMFFCGQFNILFTQWFQRKELKTNPSGFFMDFEHPELCIFFILGCFWSVNNGLSRDINHLSDPNSPLYRRAKFVFPDLHEIADASVATQMTSMIRSLVPTQLKNFYSVKSLRTGAMSQLQWNPSVLWQESVALGGWKTGANSDWYVWHYLVAIIPPVLALAGHPQPRIIPNLPDITELFHDPDPNIILSPDKFYQFINSLFVISLPEFRAPQGRLRNLLNIVTAIMIMNFRYCERKYGNGHSFVAKMVSATLSCGLAAHAFEASSKLKCWSRKLSDSLKSQNLAMTNRPLHGPMSRQDISDEIGEMKTMLSEVMRNRRINHIRFEESQQRIAELNQTIQDLHTDQQRLREVILSMHATNLPDIATSIRELTRSLTELNFSRQDDCSNSHGGTGHPRIAESQVSPNQQQCAFPPQSPMQQQPNTPEQQQQWQQLHEGEPNDLPVQPEWTAPVPLFLLQQSRSELPGTGRGRTKAEYSIKNVMMDLYDNDAFNRLTLVPPLESLWQHINGKFFKGEQRNILNIIAALQLVDALWTAQERECSIRKTFSSREAAISAYQKIGDLARRDIHILSNPVNATSTSRRKTALVGMGHAIKKIKGPKKKSKHSFLSGRISVLTMKTHSETS